MKLLKNAGLARALLLICIPTISNGMMLQTPHASFELIQLPAPMFNNFLLKPTDTKKLAPSRSSSPHPKVRPISQENPEIKLEAETKVRQHQVAVCKQDPVEREREQVLAHAFYEQERSFQTKHQSRMHAIKKAFTRHAVLEAQKQSEITALTAKIHNRLPLAIQEHIAQMYLGQHRNDTIRDHIKELMPAVIDHHSQDPEDSIFQSITAVETSLSDMWAKIHSEQSGNPNRIVHSTLRAPLTEEDEARINQRMRHDQAYFTGDEVDGNAFIGQLRGDGSIQFYLNAHNRNRLRALEHDQIQYLIQLYSVNNTLEHAQRNRKIHASLPHDILAQVEDNYQFTLPQEHQSSCTCW